LSNDRARPVLVRVDPPAGDSAPRLRGHDDGWCRGPAVRHRASLAEASRRIRGHACGLWGLTAHRSSTRAERVGCDLEQPSRSTLKRKVPDSQESGTWSEVAYSMGWLTGLEPATTGITIRDSTN